MELEVPSERKSSGDDYEMLAAGTYDAKCIDAIYPIVKQYEKNPPRNTVLFLFEVNQKRKKKDGTEDDSNYIVWSKNYTISLHAKSNLKPFLQMWSGEGMDEGTRINLEDFVGKLAKLTVVQMPQKLNPAKKSLTIAACTPGDTEVDTDPEYERQDTERFNDQVVEPENSPF